MMTTEAQHDLLAIGVLASHLGASVRRIEKVAEQLGIAPAMRLNLVPHYDADQVERIRAALSEGKR